jgi:hypothetical protein
MMVVMMEDVTVLGNGGIYDDYNDDDSSGMG